MVSMRINLSIAAGNRATWSEAQEAAIADRVSLSSLTADALRAYLANRARRLARQTEAAK